MSKFMVVLLHQNGGAVPLLNEDEYTAKLFDSVEKATEAAEKTTFGHAFGFEVIQWGAPL